MMRRTSRASEVSHPLHPSTWASVRRRSARDMLRIVWMSRGRNASIGGGSGSVNFTYTALLRINASGSIATYWPKMPFQL